jgi:uncharacterized integral membrane protein
MYRLIFIIIALLAVLGGLVVGTLNADPVTLDLLWVQINWPLGLVLVAALAIGVLLGVTLTWILQVWPTRLALRRARSALPAQGTEPDSD